MLYVRIDRDCLAMAVGKVAQYRRENTHTANRASRERNLFCSYLWTTFKMTGRSYQASL